MSAGLRWNLCIITPSNPPRPIDQHHHQTVFDYMELSATAAGHHTLELSEGSARGGLLIPEASRHAFILSRIADHKITRLDELMPWRYAQH